jgi:hypothetical protein
MRLQMTAFGRALRGLFGFPNKARAAFHDQMRLVANLDLVLTGPDGKVKTRRRIHNTYTTAGKYGAADQFLLAPTIPKPGWMEVGTGSPAATLLGAYIAGSRTALSSKTRLNAVVTMVCTFGPTIGTGAITECGLFDVVTENTVNMWASASFAVVNKAAADSLTATWEITAS